MIPISAAWNNLRPKFVSESDFEKLEPKLLVVEEIAVLSKSMSLDVDEGEINEH